jgi:hypothetical protein
MAQFRQKKKKEERQMNLEWVNARKIGRKAEVK